MRKINTIVIHCSDSPHGRNDGADDIHQWHLGRGWDGIGYHYVICEEGTVENGRPEYWIGSHVYGQNKHSIGICLIGCGEYAEVQVKNLFNLLEDLLERYPEASVYEHRFFDDSKECPLLSETILTDLQTHFGDKFIPVCH